MINERHHIRHNLTAPASAPAFALWSQLAAVAPSPDIGT
jgi:hypothetical protein